MSVQPYRPRNHELEGWVLAPSEPTALVVFLHGFGANGADLMGLGELLAPQLPSVGFIAPDAPGRLPFGANSRFWFPLNPDLKTEDLDRGVQQARPLVSSYLEAVLHDFGLPPEKLILVGFSQGCMMALEVAPRLDVTLGHVMGLSGALAGADRLADEVKAKPPVYLGHGREDPVVPFGALDRASTALQAQGFDVEAEAYDGVGHNIPNQALQKLFTLAQDLT